MNAPLPDLANRRILVVGDVMLDRYWFGDVSRISPEAPVPIVHVKRTEERPGGAANVARNITALGGHATLLAVVGEDEAGRALEDLLLRERVIASLHRDRELSTTVKLRVIGHQQQLLRIDFERPPGHEVLAAKLDEYTRLVDQAEVIILSDYGKGGLEHVGRMIQIARENGKPVLVDPKGHEYTRYKGATLLTPNRGEFREVAGRWSDDADLERRARKLRADLDLDALIVTRSEEGMSLFTAKEAWHEATRAQEVYDVSGAGDTVIATLALMVASGADLHAAMRVANHAAGIVVGKLGTAVVTREELVASLEGK
ncbi:D-glycero-beta-D-manno-heptose-7-phosphate kinase [Usitatibacter palustris]|uniref:D-beta-D-heptose 7-phosphate kinase n=1 Tax=Usitatibacter palustris TaxID=2732487 RepID=A0A6M4HAS4_9PROT|nr:D-glycero-beta-D-manno-heptose-7-phosphate kinase [Usitatibacter palustris]QJR15534.1 D-beta-D-heptose 7-phosphate kinase [Usitatibacter palustris]